jgi:hypothetical protein
MSGKMNNMIQLISHAACWVKILIGAGFSSVFSVISQKFLAFFQADDVHWYNNPALLGMLGGIITLFAGKMLDTYQKSREAKAEAAKQEKAAHQTFSERLFESQFKDRQEFIEDMREFHESKIAFKDEQIREHKLAEFIARERAHNYGGYTNMVQGYAQVLEIECKKHDIPLPYEFKFKSYPEIMEGLEEKIEAYEKRLAVEAERKMPETAKE